MSETELDRLLRGVDASALIDQGMELLGSGADDDELEALVSGEEDGVAYSEELCSYTREAVVGSDHVIGAAAIHLGAALAWRRRDLGAASILLDAMEALEDYDHSGTDVLAAQAFGALITFGAELPPECEQRIGNLAGRMTYHLTTHLLTPMPGSVRLLRSLTTHASETIRKTARERLGRAERPPWWSGLFPADPLASLSAEQAAQHEPAIRRLAERLDGTSGANDTPLSELLAPLPMSVIRPVLERMVMDASESVAETKAAAHLLFCDPEGMESIFRIFDAWSRDGRTSHYFLGRHLVGAVPEERKKDIALQLLRWIPTSRPAVDDARKSPATYAEELLVELWGKGEDVEPLLDVLRAVPEPAEGEEAGVPGLGYDLGALLKEGRVSEDSALGFLEFHLSGWPPGLRPMARYLSAHFEKLPPERLRSHVERALQCDEDALLTWGLELWLGRCYDPSRDPPHPDLARTVWRNPRWRPLLIQYGRIEPVLFVPAREALRAGDCDLEQMSNVVRLIGLCYGGVAPFCTGDGPIEYPHSDPPPDVPGHLQGPPTADEWALLRQCRDAALTREEPDAIRHAMHMLPDGPWLPEDRHVADAALAAAQAGDSHAGFMLTFRLSAKATPGDLPTFDRLEKVMPQDQREWVRSQRRRYCRLLGIALPKRGKKQPKGGEKVPETGEWMDQDE